MSEKFYDKHHILPKSKGGTNIKDNIVKLDKRKHNALHMLFDNSTTAQQIRRIIDISSTALTEEVKSDIIKILDIDDYEYWYNELIYKK